MNKLLILAILGFFLFSCNRKLYKSHSDCTEYFDYIKEHWEKKPNGWYGIKVEKVDTTAAWLLQHDGEPPVFIKQYKDNKMNCLCKLNKKEIQLLFGKPTEIESVYNVIEEVQIETIRYRVTDGKCDETAKFIWQPNPCGELIFLFTGKTQHKSCSSGLSLWGWSIP